MSVNADNPVIVADNASKLFLDGTVVAFRQLSLSVKRDEILCIVGPSGCGKTTFLRCIAGLTEINTGQLLVHGKPVAGPPDGVVCEAFIAAIICWPMARPAPRPAAVLAIPAPSPPPLVMPSAIWNFT